MPPICSGSDVVGAATIPPVGRYVRALSVSTERMTASRHSPVYLHSFAHVVQKRSVNSSAWSASTGFGGARCDGPQVITNDTFSPAETVKSPTVVRPSPDRKSTRLNSSHLVISYAVFCLKKKKKKDTLSLIQKKKKKKNKK